MELISHFSRCPYEAVKKTLHKMEKEIEELKKQLKQKDEEIEYLKMKEQLKL